MNKQLPIIDLEFGKKLSGGREDIALEMIAMLRAELPKDFLKIKTAFEKNDFSAMQVDAHRLHGAVSYCGAPALKLAVSELELALKNNLKQKIPTFFSKLEFEVNRFLEITHE